VTSSKGALKLRYLSWANAWAIVKKKFNDVSYCIKQFGEERLPFLHVDKMGYMVFTSVTINGLTYDMWLPVLSTANKPLIDNVTMSDINRTIMRCLTKNLAMFGIGLYLYMGDDIPGSATTLNTSQMYNIKRGLTPVKNNEDVN
jgi:hypothetical protein